jgi:hypothetical protein
MSMHGMERIESEWPGNPAAHAARLAEKLASAWRNSILRRIFCIFSIDFAEKNVTL